MIAHIFKRAEPMFRSSSLLFWWWWLTIFQCPSFLISGMFKEFVQIFFFKKIEFLQGIMFKCTHYYKHALTVYSLLTLGPGMRKLEAGWKKDIRRKQLKVLWRLHKNKPSEQAQLNIILTKKTSPPYAGYVKKETKQLHILCENANA